MSRRCLLPILRSILALPILPISALAQTRTSPVTTQRLSYDSIEHQLSSYRHMQADPAHLKLISDEDAPAALEAYCDGDKLRLVVATYAEEAAHSIDRYYFRNDSLFFVYHRLEVPTGPDTPNRVDEERLYFSADTLVRWLGVRNASHSLSSPSARRRAKKALGRASALHRSLDGCSEHGS